MKECIYCGLISKCPLKSKPVEQLVLKTGLIEEEYSCENLVSLYLKMKEIGQFIKEENEKEKEECLGKVD